MNRLSLAWGPKRRLLLLALMVLMVLPILSLTGAPPARAADGTTLRQINAAVPSCSVGTGIAFDGQRLLLSCWYTSDVYAVSPADGSLLETIPVSGMQGIGALAYDRARGAVWACGAFDDSVYLITLQSGSATAKKMFVTANGCVDGLAYDGTDQTLFSSGDVETTVYHYRTDGTVIDTRFVGNSLNGCGNSGLAVGGQSLFLANNGCSQIFRAAKSTDSVPALFATYPARIEDMECDDVTFAGSGKAAIWSKDAYDSVLNAFELNVGDCGFGGLPPDSGDRFVYVAMGDSYQSGEGVGNSIADDAAYLSQAYENGSNFAARIGAQEDTYTSKPSGVSANGNSCHRALANYAKLNRDRLKPGAEVVLIDVTCSGAQIEPAGKPAVVGTSGSASYAPDSQVAQAVSQLQAAGLSTSDVDLVTVGMGGNDAKFGDLVAACLLPNVVRELVKAYPNSPGEIEFAVNNFATCENVDKFFKTSEAISALGPKEEWAQQQLLTVFGDARIMQLNYPDILPEPNASPDVCGGIRKDDLAFARGKVQAIDSAVSSTASSAGNRYEVVDVESLFGPNPLCPGSADLTLANGIQQSNLKGEIDRLLNLTPGGDAQSRALLDTLVSRYNDYKSCLAKSIIGLCDRNAALDRLKAAGNDVMTYLKNNQNTLVANLLDTGSGSTPQVLFDRSRGLFHPNANGAAVLACKALTQYQGASGSDCIRATSPASDTVNGNPVTSRPFQSFFQDLLHIVMSGFGSNQPIIITEYSTAIPLGTAVSDANGTVTFDVRVPANNPGVHTIEFAGATPTGTVVRKVVRLEYPGRPAGDTYASYVCGFTPSPTTFNPAEVTYAGQSVMRLPIDENGCVLVEVPLLSLPRGPFEVPLVVTEASTGRSQTLSVRPVPRVAGIWATAGQSDAVSISGAGTVVQGLIHSDGGVSVPAAKVTGDSVEYGTTVSVNGRSSLGPQIKVPAGGIPTSASVADYRPGGPIAATDPTSYHAIAAADCVNGVWTVSPAQVPTGIVYVPCAVNFTTSGTVAATIAAEGAVTLSASRISIQPLAPAAPGIVSGNTISLVGADATVTGTVVAPSGAVSLIGARASVRCGIVSSSVSVVGANSTVMVDDKCATA